MVDSYAYAKIPLETFVTDSQYMNHDQDFTLGVEFNVSSFQVHCPLACMRPMHGSNVQCSVHVRGMQCQQHVNFRGL